MAQTKTKPKTATNKPTVSPVSDEAATTVLTLAEAAAYLRLSEPEVVRLVHYQGLPGRSTGTEWRFLKAAIQDWLRSPPAPSAQEAILSRIGNWKDDPYLDDELKEIYRQRGRPMTGDAS